MSEYRTSGPWSVGTDGSRVFPFVKGADGSPVASCGGQVPGSGVYSNESAARRRANAQLIAAAPDLLEALKAMLVWVEGDEGPGAFLRDRAKAMAAIAKAEGA